ncbi:MAG: alanine racemase [Ignavibacteriaceae bacterium]
MRPTYAIINLSNLKYNYLNICRKIKDVKVMAVVKADAYGHGSVEIANALNSLKVKKPEYFAVAIPEEAIELRKHNIKQPMLVFDPFNNVQAELIFKYNLIPTVFSADHINVLLKAKNNFASVKRIKVHVKIDTGMNRLGIDYNYAFDFVKKISHDNNFIIDGIYTHFATSDERDKTFANLQLKRFNDLLNKFKSEKINVGITHAANSGAILDMPEAYFDMVRPGILLYGYYPSTKTSNSIKIKPVMSLFSTVTSVKKITSGETVSYGRKFKALEETRIASVPIGYADGFTRGLSNSVKAIMKGKLFQQVGTVTMDRIMFNIGNEMIFPNDEVILLGMSKKLKVDAQDWADILKTIPYEIICGISKRVPRIYKD